MRGQNAEQAYLKKRLSGFLDEEVGIYAVVIRFENCLVECGKDQLYWKRNALALLKALAFDLRVKLLLITDLPESIAISKLRSAGIKAQVLSSAAECAAAGPRRLASPFRSGAQSEAFLRLLHSSRKFRRIFVIGSGAADGPLFRQGIGVVVSEDKEVGRMAQFTAENLKKAKSILWSLLEYGWA